MKPKLPVIVATLVIVLVIAVGAAIWQKSQVKTSPASTASTAVKKVDLSSQPEWVQKLTVKVTRGRSANGLKNFTFMASGMPAGLVKTVGYVVQYQTTNKGTQGSLSTTPIDVSGATEFSRTIDFGTCSTKSCVTHDGVTSVDLELDFTTMAGDQFTWSNTLTLP